MLNKKTSFVGRKIELEKLKGFFQKKTASLIVIRGRRRIGKSRLVEEFAKNFTFYSFAGLAPTPKTTAQSQRNEFSQQLSKQAKMPEMQVDDWSKLFYLLWEKVKTNRVILLFDEISWMGEKDPDFLGKLKNAWDLMFKKNPQLILILCGSASSWIEENILNNTGFLGRISYTLTLGELPLKECNHFWPAKNKNISAYEKLKLLSITGGVPRYLEEINPTISAEDNIKELCFSPGGILVNEFEYIFANMFNRNSTWYKEIIKALIYDSKETSKISEVIQVKMSGLLSNYLEELVLAGFLKRDYTWQLKSGKDTKLSKYRLSDNYLRFYLRYVDKYRTKIDRGNFIFKSIASLAEWPTIMGLQFENLVLNNRSFIHNILQLSPEEIISDNPFFQRPTTKQKGCQIDYLIQTKFANLYICEVKFSQQPIGLGIMNEVQTKIDRLKRPKGFSCRPVLIHVNGVQQDVINSDYFAKIIDFTDVLSN